MNNEIKLRTELCVELTNKEKFSKVFDILGINIDEKIRDEFDELTKTKRTFAGEFRSKAVEVYKVNNLYYIKISEEPHLLDYRKADKDYVSDDFLGKCTILK